MGCQGCGKDFWSCKVQNLGVTTTLASPGCVAEDLNHLIIWKWHKSILCLKIKINVTTGWKWPNIHNNVNYAMTIWRNKVIGQKYLHSTSSPHLDFKIKGFVTKSCHFGRFSLVVISWLKQLLWEMYEIMRGNHTHSVSQPSVMNRTSTRNHRGTNWETNPTDPDVNVGSLVLFFNIKQLDKSF